MNRLSSAIVALGVLFPGCKDDARTATQVLVRITAQGAALNATVVRVRGLGGARGAVEERRVVDIPVSNGWPVEVAMEPRGGDPARLWRVEAWALDDGVELGAGARDGTFTAGTLVEETLVLKPGVSLGAVPEPTGGDDAGAPSTVNDAAVDGSALGQTDAGTLDGGDGSTAGGGGSGGDACATDNGGCDRLVTCRSVSAVVTCGACPDGYDDVKGDGTVCTATTCDGMNVCTPDYPCQDLTDGYTCRGQFADWPPTYSASAFTPNGDGIVTDSRSGLAWQQDVDAGTYSWPDARAFCDELELSGIGWRLPTKAELESIVDDGRSSPAIDPTAFPNTPAIEFWSSSPRADYPEYGWILDFSSGSSSYTVPSAAHAVRCVRSTTATIESSGAGGVPPGRYEYPEEGTVFDTLTRLTWQRTLDGSGHPWIAAQGYCTGLSLAGLGWRLPSRAELLTLVDPTQTNPAIDSTAFPNAGAGGGLWSSSPYVGSAGNAWIVDLSYGMGSEGQSPTSEYGVRCVR